MDEADRGAQSSRVVGEILGMSHGRVQQIEVIAFRKLAKVLDRSMIAGFTNVVEPEHGDNWGDFDGFKAAVDKAHDRIVPAHERGRRALRVTTKGTR